MGSDQWRQLSVLCSLIAMIGMNYLATVGAFGGQTNADISGKYRTLITPAGYAFALWGPIFLGLLAFAVYQALPAQRTNPRFRAIGWWVVFNAFCNAIWSPLFNNERIGWALLVILMMLGSLTIIEHHLLARRHTPFILVDGDATLPETATPSMETWLVRVPFSIYFGWLTIATILNVAVYLKATQFDAVTLSEPVWAVVTLIVGLVIGATVFNRFRSVAYSLVFAWAYVAIGVEQAAYDQIRLVAGIGAVIATGTAVGSLLNRKIPVYS